MSIVSAIITTHNRPVKYVMRALNSVLNQTHTNIEIIVVDDSDSTYEQRDLVAHAIEMRENSSIHYIRHDTCQGACAARNTGLYKATGDFVAFLDDDDEWLPDKIEKQLVKFVQPNIALVYCGAKIVNDETGNVREGQKDFFTGFVFDKLMHNNFIGSTSFPLIRRESLVSIGGFDTEMQSAQDFDVWLRLAKDHKVDYVPESLVIYHEHSLGQITANPQKRIAGLERIVLKNEEYLSQNKQAWWRRNIMISPYYAQAGHIAKALSVWKNSALKCPQKAVQNTKFLAKILVHWYYYKSNPTTSK